MEKEKESTLMDKMLRGSKHINTKVRTVGVSGNQLHMSRYFRR